jgi:hypothetical protein
LVRQLTRGLRRDIPVHRLPLHINDAGVADLCCQLLEEMLQREPDAHGLDAA